MTASSTPAVLAELGDRELVGALRDGNSRAVDELWRRHATAARSYAWTFRELADPDDLVSEAFTRVYTKIRDGGGPDAGFRPYLLSTVRNAAVSWGRARAKEVDHDDFDVIIGGDSAEHDAFKKLEGSVTLKAFRSLPSRWQEALWYSEVEGLPREEVARLLGLNANAVSQLTSRAREGLKTAWVAQHLRSGDLPAECAAVFGSIAGYARNAISRRERRKVDAHVPTCARCMILVEEADDVSSRLAFVLIPAFLGIGATTYLSLTPDGMAVAAAFDPVSPGSSTGPGAATVASAGGAVGVATVAAAGAAVAAPARGGGWALPVGLGAASVAVVGIAAAVAFLPGVFFTAPVTIGDDGVIAAPASPTASPTAATSPETPAPNASETARAEDPRVDEREDAVDPGVSERIPAPRPISSLRPVDVVETTPSAPPLPGPQPQPTESPAPSPSPSPAPAPGPAPGTEPSATPEPAPTAEPAPTPVPEPEPTAAPAPPATIWSADPSGWLLPVVSGSADPGSTVRLFSSGSLVAEVVSSADGSWSVTPVPLAPGRHLLTSVQVAPDGRVSTASPPVSVELITPAAEATRANSGRGDVTVTVPSALRVVSTDGSCRSESSSPADDGSFTTVTLVCTGLPSADAGVRLRLETAPDGGGGVGPEFVVHFDDVADAPPSSPVTTAPEHRLPGLGDTRLR